MSDMVLIAFLVLCQLAWCLQVLRLCLALDVYQRLAQ